MTTPSDDASLLAGRYELGATLGRGGMADVYRAVDRVLNRPVAVKMLRETAADESGRARFVAEARTLAGLSHSGLVTVLDAGFGPDARAPISPHMATVDQPFLVMELVDGRSLAQAIEDGPLELDEVERIGAQVAEALAYVHAHDVIHRDIKPGNVLLGPEHRVKLADFGIARLLGDTVRHTRTGQAIGTAAYFAPEQVTGRDVSGATDVYSLGLVLLEAVTGRLAYPGPAAEAAIARLSRPPDVPEVIPDRWRRLLTGMTALEPADRPDAAEVAAQLDDQLSEPVPGTTDGSTATQTLPLLASDGAAQETRLLTETAQADAAPSHVAPVPAIDRAGEVLARQLRRLGERLRGLTPSQRGVLGSVAALLLLLLAVAVVGSNDAETSDIPGNTPAEMREPLRELHRAVNGDRG